jgi:hypothetical protein
MNSNCSNLLIFKDQKIKALSKQIQTISKRMWLKDLFSTNSSKTSLFSRSKLTENLSIFRKTDTPFNHTAYQRKDQFTRSKIEILGVLR